jgi:hypothetical protein
MNLRTTLVLAALVIGGGLFWLGYGLLQPTEADSETVAFLKNELRDSKLSRVEIKHGDRRVVLERDAGGEWSLPGKWPVREREVRQLLELLTSLHSRFAAIPISDESDLIKYGLDKEPLLVHVKVNGDDHTLSLAAKPGERNRFAQPTYLRLDKKPEVVRLAPGLVAALDRPQEVYQQRRLFPAERVAREEDSQEKVDQLAAKAITVKGKDIHYSLIKKDGDWELQEPVRDRPDPDRLKSILASIPDLWAENFVEPKGKKPHGFGLDKPEQTISVTRPGGATLTLLVGKQSSLKKREITKPSPPFGPPQPPQKEMILEEYRYAKLQDNDQIFEIKGDKLKDVAVEADKLRDPRLARFRSEDARRLEIEHDGRHILLVREKGKDKDADAWQLQKPYSVPAEESQVNDLLDKLSGLRAEGKDIIDKVDAKARGLDKPAVVKVTLEESKGKGESKIKKTRELTFLVGKKDMNKLFVQVAGWPRVNAVDDSLLKLVERPALAYRGRRVLDVPSTDVAKLEVRRGDEAFTLEKKKDWQITAPVKAEADSFRVDQLARELSKLEAAEFITEEAKKEDLDKIYGLAKPDVTAKVVFADEKKPAETLLLGKQRPGKEDYYARLESSPAVFVVKKDTREALDKGSLAYRVTQLWRVPENQVSNIRIQKEGSDYQLKRDGEAWKIAGPFEAKALPEKARDIAEELSTLRAERFVTHAAKDPADYGLKSPYLRVAFTPTSSKPQEAEPKDKDAKKEVKEPKEHVLLVGKPVGKESKQEKETKGRYARLGDDPAVFVLDEKVVAALDHSALDLLDRNLLSVDTRTIQQVRKTGADGFAIQKENDEWQVTGSPAPPFIADKEAVKETFGAWGNLKAKRFAAYGPKVDLAVYGLDKPAAQISVTLQPAEDKDKKAVEHSLALGKPVEGAKGERYARLDTAPGVFVLDADTVGDVNRSHLDFLDRQVLKFDFDAASALYRQMGKEELEVVKKDEKWIVAKPAEKPADTLIVEGILEKLFQLRAKRIAAYPAKDLKPFGLENPAATVTIRLGDPQSKPSQRVLKIGQPLKNEGGASGDRFAQVDSTDKVFVLSEDLAKRLLAPALEFRDHNLASFSTADKVVLERGPRKATFAKQDGIWRMTEPVKTDAEDAELEELLRSLVRLRADELVADKPADLKPYGLSPPLARWRFYSGDKEVLDLLIGTAEAGKKEQKDSRHYAKLAAGDLVFLLKPQTTAKALAEYRGRKVWDRPLDAAQVGKVTFAYASGPFALKKDDNSWSVSGKSEVKVDAKAVSDTLDALAGLKVERYVADQGADLALYGLKTPNLAVEIETLSGKHVLHIGRPEGETKRYYARVPEAKDNAVFVISEDAAARIVRGLSAFLSKEPAQKKDADKGKTKT